MSDSDVLARAAKALREAHTGEREGSGFTRARIMNGVHRQRRRHVLRWAVFSPLASLLLVGSAWAQSTGKWPVIWKAVAAVFVAAPTPPEAGGSPRAVGVPKRTGCSRARCRARRGSSGGARCPSTADTAREVVPEAPRVEEPSPPLPAPPRTRRPRPRRKAVEAALPRSEPPSAERAPEAPRAARARARWRLQLPGSPRHAFRESPARRHRRLRRLPAEVPERALRAGGAIQWRARSNQARQLGRRARGARAFCRRPLGSYRRKEARELLDALP